MQISSWLTPSEAPSQAVSRLDYHVWVRVAIGGVVRVRADRLPSNFFSNAARRIHVLKEANSGPISRDVKIIGVDSITRT